MDLHLNILYVNRVWLKVKVDKVCKIYGSYCGENMQRQFQNTSKIQTKLYLNDQYEVQLITRPVESVNVRMNLYKTMNHSSRLKSDITKISFVNSVDYNTFQNEPSNLHKMSHYYYTDIHYQQGILAVLLKLRTQS